MTLAACEFIQVSTSLDWVQYRLTDWAAWAMGGFGGGYPSRSAFVVERIQSEHGYVEVTREIELTDLAIARARQEKFRHWLMIRKRYLARLGIKEIATEMHRSEELIRQLVWAAESAVSRHLILLESPATLEE